MILLWFISMFLLCLLIYLYFDYRSGITNTDYKIIKLTWSQVKQFYWIDPSKWNYKTIVKKNFMTVETYLKFLVYSPKKSWRNCEGTYVIQLSFIDSIKFFFARHFNRSCYNKDTEEFLNSVQLDINKAREESQKQIEIALMEMGNIIK